MILTFPYSDPLGIKCNASFARQLSTLQSAFDLICLSVVPPTAENNDRFIAYLEGQGCHVVQNAVDSQHGTHSRAGLRLALEHAHGENPIFFGFLDRILFALETEWRATFLQDLTAHASEEFVLFERSEFAWATHPANYREIEHMVSRMYELMGAGSIDLMPCGFIFSSRTADILLSQSVAVSTDVWGEWVLLAKKNRIPITRRKVDWLAWKDPYWEHCPPEELKRIREASQDETSKRIKMNVPTMLLLTEQRFRNLNEARDSAQGD